VLRQATVRFTHCYREANQLVDWLATMAMNSQASNTYVSYQQLPKGEKGPFLMDKRQIPNIRSKFDKANFMLARQID